MADKVNPYDFLDLINRRRKGKLKVYIGMIAGVGKTYRMLQEAHALLAKGVDVRIGEIVTHGRAETEALVAGIPVIPPRECFYKARAFTEMDLEGILKAKPDVVLVDELAHSNAPGSKNPKRWQDVVDILEAGINVITAFNVQHLDSLRDKVKEVTGIEVTECIPDKFLEHADEVVNIDLPAQDLIQRLRDGKIYAPERARYALDNYFNPENILHLRDLALRKVAQKVEQKISRGISAVKYSPERFLACVSTNYAGGQRILRKTARLSTHYQAEWVVLYVQKSTEGRDKIELATQRKLLDNLRWAAEQGAEVLRRPGDDVAAVVHEVIQERKITTVVIGRPRAGWWANLTGRNYFRNLLDKLAGGDTDIVIVA